jgi:hypothetical protein
MCWVLLDRWWARPRRPTSSCSADAGVGLDAVKELVLTVAQPLPAPSRGKPAFAQSISSLCLPETLPTHHVFPQSVLTADISVNITVLGHYTVFSPKSDLSVPESFVTNWAITAPNLDLFLYHTIPHILPTLLSGASQLLS